MPPLVGISLSTVASLVDRRAGTVMFGVVTAGLAGVLMLAVLRTGEVDPTLLVFALAAVAGVGSPCWS